MRGMIILVSLVIPILVGCTTTQKGAGIGAATGAALGTVVGHQSGKEIEGAAIGSVVGGVAGAAIGQEVGKVKFCPTCGAEYPETANFCSQCGTELRWKGQTELKPQQERRGPVTRPGQRRRRRR